MDTRQSINQKVWDWEQEMKHKNVYQIMGKVKYVFRCELCKEKFSGAKGVPKSYCPACRIKHPSLKKN